MSSDSSPDGVLNPSGYKFLGIAPPIFLAAVPLSSWLSQPGGLIEKIIHGIARGTVYAGSAGTTTSVPAARIVPALSALYLFLVYGVGGASSASAIDLGTKGRDNARKVDK